MKRFLLFILFLIFTINIYSIKIENNMAVDSYGNSVELKEYKRIVVADPSAVEIFYLIGGEDKISAIAKTKINKIYPEEKTKYLESVGTITKPSFEKIISLTPDLVILNPMGAVKSTELLKKYNIPFFIDRSVTFNEIFLKTKIYGVFTRQERNAEKLINEKKDKLKEIEKNIMDKKLKGVVLYSNSPMVSFSKDTIPGEILKLLKIENMAESFAGGKSQIISSETILKENPDVIIGTMKIKSPEEIVSSNEFLKYSNAYKNNNIYVFESEKILRATPRIVDGIEEIYEVIKNVK
ncbi:ABC transporter substrate-binding protein [Fusobacterium perfoetens]|uniref:ABC transporter substrate-binding protein n=1 Tax=Fusobacterium perfoetens TaxID=852 RepID=UPI001F171CFA|nr:ABC transporter substrate-binding protein [Fusobacterium perfoetens]MCF2626390.1 ABC transporter substrate-binding protein [Fusobacterium perfoetens]